MRQQTPMMWRIAITIASSALLALPAEALTLQNLEASKTQATTCSPPPAATSFSTTDPNVYLYFVLQGLKAGDQVSAHWLNPSNVWAFTTSWNKLTSAGNFCFPNGYMSLVQLAVSGNWWVEIYVNGQYQGHTQFTLTAPCTVPTSLQMTFSQGSSTPTVLVANQADQVQLHLSTSPARQTALSVSANIGALGNVNTTSSGTVDAYYTSGNLPSGGTSSVKTAFTARACNVAIPSISAPTIYNYNGFNVHESLMPTWSFTDSNTFNVNSIQAILQSRSSFLKSFVFVGYAGGFLDTNNNGKYDKGEPMIGSVAIGATGTLASSVISSIAKTFGINPKILLATAQKEKSLLSASTLPAKSTLDWGLGCGNPSDFRSQFECSARTFMNWFSAGRVLSYPYSLSPIQHNPGTGLVTLMVRINNEATYSQYKYTPYIQDQPNGGGVYLFESILASIN
jgi:hypothetical protein